MIAIGFHESCHLWAAKSQKLQTRGFYIFPFMGGVALVADTYKTLAQQAIVVLAGPIGGGLLALLTAVLYYFTSVPLIAAAASWMLLINVLNLLPLSCLDGGQLLDTITYSINRTVGMVFKITSNIVAPIVMLIFFNPMIAIIIGFLGYAVSLKEFKNWKHYKNKEYELCDHNYLYPPKKLSVKNIVLVAATWVVAAVVMLTVNHLLLQHVSLFILFGK